MKAGSRKGGEMDRTSEMSGDEGKGEEWTWKRTLEGRCGWAGTRKRTWMKDEVVEKMREEDEAAEKAGETEVQAARGKRAELYNRIGDKVGYIVGD